MPTVEPSPEAGKSLSYVTIVFRWDYLVRYPSPLPFALAPTPGSAELALAHGAIISAYATC